MTPAQSKAAFLAEGLRVVEIPGYQTNDRAPATGRPAGPKHGLVNHHTGGDTSNPYAYAAGILSKGSSALVGPLCHEGLDPDTGTLYMVGTGRTNHAGGGDPAVLAAVIADAVPYDRELKPTKGNLDGVDGNAPFYGLEVMYSGARDVPRVGYVAIVRWNVARCRFHGWSGASAIAHREWSNDKPDPGRVNLPQLRRDVDAALALPPGAWGSTTPPPTSEEDDMADAATTALLNRILQQATGANENAAEARRVAGVAVGAVAPGNAAEATLAGRLAALEAAVAGIKDHDDLDENALADAVVGHMGADFANKVIDALGTRINAGTGGAASAPDGAPESVETLPECADPDDQNNT
jgi:hypothetical protein